MTRVYLDHNATTPPHPEVVGEMMRVLEGCFGNPNSVHREGTEARYVLEKARRTILRAINARKGDRLIFTGSASEADNLALRGALKALGRGGEVPLLAISAVEHKAVLEPARALEQEGAARLKILDVDEFGRVASNGFRSLQGGQPAVVSVNLANSELGGIEPLADHVRAIRGAAGEHPVLIHTDAAQALGRIPVDVQALGVDIATFNAHKTYGPKGIGALYLRKGVQLAPLILGGGQEEGLRAGTEDPSHAAGFARAVEVSLEALPEETQRLEDLREQLWRQIAHAFGELIVRNSTHINCLPGTLSFSIPGHESRSLVRELDARGFAVSAGSACSSGGGTEISHVLLAAGAGEERARAALRVSLGRSNTGEDVSRFTEALQEIVGSSVRQP